MKEERPSHSLLSFTRYLNQVFHFGGATAGLRDARHDPDFPPAAVFGAVFYGFVFRLSSFKQLEADLAQPHLQRFLGVEQPFRDDTFRYSLCGFELEPLEQMLVDINRRLKRSKAFDPGRVQGRLVAALDGIEVLSSYSRCCDSCLQRRVTSRDPEGQPVERLQYYHRAVACQIVSSPVKSILAVEWLQPGEGEDTAALRLLARLPQLYGSRFFDILLLDSLYAQAPVLRLAQQIDWDLVITLKQEARDLYQSAMRLFDNRPPDEEFTEELPGKRYQVRLWETEGLPFTEDYPQPMRVLWSQEKLTQNHYQQKQLQPETTDHKWVWITTLDAKVFRAPVVRRLGHGRWKQENNGWNDLTQNWALKHGFLHACKHRPRQPAPDGPPRPVTNRGLAAVTLIRCLAFVLCAAFTLRHSKLVRRYGLSLREVSRQLYRSLWLQPPIRAPA
jgi:hypothetical protein